MKSFKTSAFYFKMRLFLKLTFQGLLFASAVAGQMYAATDIHQVTPEDLKKIVKQADKFTRQGNYSEAEKLLKKAIDINPANSANKLKLAHVYLKQRKLVESYDTSFAVAKAEPKNATAFAVLGSALLGVGKFAEARAVYFKAIQLNKREAIAWAGFGMLEFYENRIEESLANLREAVFHSPNEPDYVFALAQVSARSEKYKEAAEAYNTFLTISQNTDDERRERIKGLINFLRFLGNKSSLYYNSGSQQTTVPFELTGNRPVIRLKVNGRAETLRFVLDTGSGISVLSDETAKRLKIEPITRGGFAKGIGGDGRFEIVYGFLRQISIGEVNIRNVPVYIRRFHSTTPIDGYIGLSLISKFLTTIDYGNQTFAMQRKDFDLAESPLNNPLSLPLRLTSSGFLSGEVQLEGVQVPLNFIVDTGASVSVISDEVASLDSISPFVQSERIRVVGSAGITDDVPSFLLPKVSFGSHSRKSITAIALDLDLINEAAGFEQAGILGGNFLRNYRMTFDFKNSRVTFVPIVQEP